MDAEQLGKLLIASAAGNRDAFAKVYRASAPQLLALAIRITQNRPIAEDALQETFVQAWYSAKDYDPSKGSAAGWLAGILRHRAIDARRRELVRQPPAEALIPEDEVIVDSTTAAVSNNQDLHALIRCLQPLVAAQRRSILLAYYFGYSHSEVAARLEMPLGTIKTWIRRGMASVRECLQQ